MMYCGLDYSSDYILKDIKWFDKEDEANEWLNTEEYDFRNRELYSGEYKEDVARKVVEENDGSLMGYYESCFPSDYEITNDDLIELIVEEYFC